MIRKQQVSGTTVLRGGIADILKVAAGAGLLSDTLPAEVLADVTAPVAATALDEAAPSAATTTGGKLRLQYTRPSGEVFWARKVKFGDRDTTDIDVLRDGIRGGLSMFVTSEAGTGKTSCIEAAVWDWDFTNGMETILCTGSTVAADFTGSQVPQPDGTFLWVDGPLVRAMESGKALYVDEIGRVDPKELVVLYSVMDGRGMLTVDENPARGTIRTAPGFFVIASTNPNAPGCVMDDALLSRFAPPITYSTDWSIAVRRLGVPSEVAALARDMRKAVRSGVAYWSPEMRSLLQWKTAAAVWGERAAWLGLISDAPIEARPEVIAAIETATGMKLDPEGWTI